MTRISVCFVKKSSSVRQGARKKLGKIEQLCFYKRDQCLFSLEAINFYLLHLSLMREYLNLEFHDIEPSLPFAYNLERVIDDFILLAVFVGNDFLPHLPDLHIHENGLERLFEVYKRVLPRMGGYLNESVSSTPAVCNSSWMK